MKVGELDILPVFDGTGRMVAREFLTRPGHDDPWSCHADQIDAEGWLQFTLGGFLLRTGDRTVLIDAGVGAINHKGFVGGDFLDGLAGYGVAPADVTDVVFTHLHFDHVGWATQQGEVVFPRATYRVHADDWAHFVDSPDADPRAVGKLSPLADQLEPFDTDHTIAPGLDARHTPGHTPGSTVFVVSSAGQRALLVGDVVHSVVELTEPDWECVYDLDKRAAKAVREALVDEVIDTEDAIGAAHFPGLRFGRVVTVDGGRGWQYL